MSLIILDGKYGAIDDDYCSCHGYCIIKFTSSKYNLQSNFGIDGQVISSGKMVCEGTYFFPININSHYYVLQKPKPINTIVSYRTITNGNINIICYDSKNVVTMCLRYIS